MRHCLQRGVLPRPARAGPLFEHVQETAFPSPFPHRSACLLYSGPAALAGEAIAGAYIVRKDRLTII